MLNLLLTWAMMARSGVERHSPTRRRLEDEARSPYSALTITAAVASLGAIAAELTASIAGPREGPALRIALAGTTDPVLMAFRADHFALHYAHECYGGPGAISGAWPFPRQARAGPDYWDFLYFAVTIGAASQTSDVTVVSHRTRRYVLAHTILSFLFNTTVLALAINVGASLL